MSATPSKIGHLDETGQTCSRHAPVSEDALLALAMVGARAATFHHDIASKLQGLMMALDEIHELVETRPDPDILRAAETAQTALGDLNQLLSANRMLTKPPVRARTSLRDMLARAGERVGVNLRGPQVAGEVAVSIPGMTHAFALAIDAAAGVGRSRALAYEAIATDGRIELVFPRPLQSSPSASETLAIAAWLFARDGAELRCTDAGVAIRVETTST